MRRRLKAFTLLELLVAMAIMGIVISIAGLVYNMLDGQFHTYRKTNERISSVFTLNNRIVTDFMEASAIERSVEGIIVRRQKKDSVQYIFSGKNIIRIDPGKTDTFHVIAEEPQYLFKQELQEKGLIDELKMTVVIFEERGMLHFTKHYGIAAELNLENEKDAY